MTSIRMIAAFAVVAGCYFASAILIPLVVAFFLAALLDPLIVRLEKNGFPRWVSSPVVVFAFLLATGIITWGGYASITEVATEVPNYSAKIRSVLSGFQQRAAKLDRKAHNLMPIPEKLESVLKVEIVERYSGWAQVALQGMRSAFNVGTIAIFIPLLLFFLLLEKETLLRALEGTPTHSHEVRKIIHSVSRMVTAYFIGNLVIGLALGFLQAVVFFKLGLQNGVAIGFVTGFMNVIPLVGAPMAVLLPLSQGLLQFESPTPFLIVIGTIVGIHLIANNYVIPKFIGKRVNLSPTVAAISLLFWGWLWGTVGFFMAIPLTALLRILFESNVDTFQIANVLAARPRDVPPCKEILTLSLSARARTSLDARKHFLNL